jgi:hypothetical protein
MIRRIGILKGKPKFIFNNCGFFKINAMPILMIFFVISLINLQLGCSQSVGDNSIWDKPFSSPQYLLHATGHGTTNGPVKDDLWFLHSKQPKNGFIDLPDGMGGTFTYSIDQYQGPFNTPREVCTAASEKAKESSLGGFNCKDMAAQPEKPNKPEEGPCANACDKSKHLVWDGYEGCSCICDQGWKFDEYGDCRLDTSETDDALEGGINELEDEILVVTPQGTTVAKPGDSGQIALSSGQKAEIDAKCNEMKTALTLLLATSLREQDDKYDEPTDMSVGLTYTLIKIACESLKSGKPISFQKTAEFADFSSSSAIDYPVKLEFGLQSGSLRIETVHDQVALNVNTPTVTISSAGKDTFGVTYDPNSGKSYVAAYQNPLRLQPSNQAPFTLGSGQQVEVSSSGIGPITTIGQTTEGSTYVSPDGRDIYGTLEGAGNTAGQTGATSEGPQSGCYTDPSTGQMVCVDGISDFANPSGDQEQGGCYSDPISGETICVDTFGDFNNPSSNTGTAYTMQPDAGSSVPQSLQECETYTSEICGTWTRMGDRFNAQWNNGASAMLNVERWDNGAVVLTRQDTQGSSAGLTARYEGRLIGNHVDGSVTWNWNGATWSGTWTADW